MVDKPKPDSGGSSKFIAHQKDLDEIASSLDIKYQVEDNLSGGHALYSASITLTNSSNITVGYCPDGKQWSIYFSHLRMVEPLYLPKQDSVNLEYASVSFSHLNGCIFNLTPLSTFKPLKKGDSLKIKFNAQRYAASKSDILPNWYIVMEGLEPRVLRSTEGESLSFVGPYNLPKQYKRFDYVLSSGSRRYDRYQPFTPEVRFSLYPDEEADSVDRSVPIIPSVKHYKSEDGDQCVDISESGWKIVGCGDEFQNEAAYLSEKTGIPVEKKEVTVDYCDTHPARVVALRKTVKENPSDIERESYSLHVVASSNYIEISSVAAAGIFYGIQSLLSLSESSASNSKGKVVNCEIEDSPRYPYRGMHVDISRNFQPKEEILKVLDAMALYKLNKFHFHLTDDEGWRLQIPGLDELIQIGSKRGHNPRENDCLLPLLGSGPHPTGLGCGFYTVEDYKDILRYAHARHIQVIPEIDMPGHSHAAVRAMRVRYERLSAQGKKKEGEKYLLSDPSEGLSHSLSVQMMTENSMNPGLESTYVFIDKVIEELQAMHEDIQPLQMFHLGGDEVPLEVWDDSPACIALVEADEVPCMEGLMEYFVTRVGSIAHKHGLELGAWQDGIISDMQVTKQSEPYERKKFPNKRVLVHFWRNVWETGLVYDAYKLANAGYEVVLSPGTHLYFDHPHEPDPEERGLYWACRFLDTHKVFRFAPDHLLSNADVKLTGEKLTPSDIKALKESEDYTALKQPSNIKGIQGQIWTELVRTAQQFHEMIFPRLVALAERAWHEAPWESLEVKVRKSEEEKDWSRFANALGHRELGRLEALDIPYHIPPPGARVSGDGCLEMRSCYPGLPLFYSTDSGNTWKRYTQPVDVASLQEEVQIKCCSHNGHLSSRMTTVPVPAFASDGSDSRPEDLSH